MAVPEFDPGSVQNRTDQRSSAAIERELFEMVYRSMRSLAGPHALDLEDLVQSAAEQVLKSLPAFDQRSELRTWVYAVLAYDLDLTIPFGERQIQILRADGSCEREFVWATGEGKNAKQPAFSADGKKIAFAADNTGTFQIYVMDLVSGEQTQITSAAAGATHPSWAPTGNAIAYVTGDPEDQYTPYTSDHGNSSSVAMLVDITTLQTTALTAAKQPAFISSAFVTDQLLLVSNSVSVTGIHTDTLAQYAAAPEAATEETMISPSVSPDGSQLW